MFHQNRVSVSFFVRVERLSGGFAFHVARHTFATICLNIGMPIEVVSALLGHQDIRTTRVYAVMIDQTIQKNMQLWDKLTV